MKKHLSIGKKFKLFQIMNPSTWPIWHTKLETGSLNLEGSKRRSLIYAKKQYDFILFLLFIFLLLAFLLP